MMDFSFETPSTTISRPNPQLNRYSPRPSNTSSSSLLTEDLFRGPALAISIPDGPFLFLVLIMRPDCLSDPGPGLFLYRRGVGMPGRRAASCRCGFNPARGTLALGRVARASRYREPSAAPSDLGASPDSASGNPRAILARLVRRAR